MHVLCRVAMAAVVVAMGAGSAGAATIDVDNLVEGPPFVASASGLAATSTVSPDLGAFTGVALQNWTVNKSGRLERIDIFGNANSNLSTDNVNWSIDADFLLTVTILRGGTEWTPGDVELGSVSKFVSELGGWQNSTSSFDLGDLGIQASQGDLLTFRMSVEACPQIAYCTFGWSSWHTLAGIGTTNGYDGGRAFTVTASGLHAFDYDLNFRTWTSAVPEPGAWAMMILGFGAVGTALRTSRRKSVRESQSGAIC